MIPGYDDRPWRVWHAVAALAAGLGASVLAAAAVGPEITAAETWRALLPAQTAAQILLVAALAAVSARRRAALGPGFEASDLIGVPIGVALLVGGSLLLTAVGSLFFDDPPVQAVVESAADSTGIDVFMVVVFAGLAAPLAEELVFRGVLLRALMVNRSASFAVYVSSAAFAGIHLLDPDAWLAVPLLFVLGVVMARQAVATGRLARPIVIHATFNLLSVASLFLVE